MKTKVTFVLFFILLSLILHGYLSSHYYPLIYGLGSENSMCNVGETFNCDAAAASSFSSVFEVPLSIWGFATNLVILFLTLTFWLGFSDRPKRILRTAFYVAGLSAGASLVMAVISLTQLNIYCLFCILLYFLSFAILGGLWSLQEESPFSSLKEDFTHLFGPAKTLLIAFVAIPLIAFSSHKFFVRSYEAGELNKVVRSLILDWKSSSAIPFSASPSFSLGASEEKAKLTLSEFADFRCGHCKNAAPALHAFVKSHMQEVRFNFYSFPLDGSCNTEINGGDGISCRLAKSVLCASEQGKGAQMHDEIFDKFDAFHRVGDVDQTDKEIQTLTEKLALDFTKLQECMNQSSTQDRILEQVKQGVLAGVRGTPSIYANGKRLNRGELIPVLEKALKESKN